MREARLPHYVTEEAKRIHDQMSTCPTCGSPTTELSAEVISDHPSALSFPGQIPLSWTFACPYCAANMSIVYHGGAVWVTEIHEVGSKWRGRMRRYADRFFPPSIALATLGMAIIACALLGSDADMRVTLCAIGGPLAGFGLWSRLRRDKKQDDEE